VHAENCLNNGLTDLASFQQMFPDRELEVMSTHKPPVKGDVIVVTLNSVQGEVKEH
jgi:hypothetical protein